jgi:Zn-dependent peptidase ImmA (M78 family)
VTAETEGKARAESFRTEYSLGFLPLGDLVSLIELTQHFDVAILDAGHDEHGMAMRDPTRGVVMVAAARTRNPMRQRSTLAHELGHVLFDDGAPPRAEGWADRSPQEIRADAFARHLLVPVQGVQAVLGDRRPAAISDLSMLVQRFQASPALVAIQMHRAGYLSSARKDEWIGLSTLTLAARFGWTDRYHALQNESDTRRAPQRLLARATAGYIANVISLQAIARLRGVDVAEVDTGFAEAGIVPDAAPAGWAEADDLLAPEVDFGNLDALDAETDHG